MGKKKNKKNLKKTKNQSHNYKKTIKQQATKKSNNLLYILGALFFMLIFGFFYLLYKISSNQTTISKPSTTSSENINSKYDTKNILKKSSLQKQVNKPKQEKNSYMKVTYSGYTYQAKLMPDGNYWLVDNIKHILTGNTYCYDNKEENCKKYGRLYQRNAMFIYDTKFVFIPTSIAIKNNTGFVQHKPFKAKINNGKIQLNTGYIYMLSGNILYKQVKQRYISKNVCSVLGTGWFLPTDKDFIKLEHSLGCRDYNLEGERCFGLGWLGNKLGGIVKGLYGRRYYKYNFGSFDKSIAFWLKDDFMYRNLSYTQNTIYRGVLPDNTGLGYMPNAMYIKCFYKPNKK